MSSDSRESSPFTVKSRDSNRRHSEDIDVTSDIEDDADVAMVEVDAENNIENLAEKEREVQRMLLEATAKKVEEEKAEAEARRLKAEAEAEKATDLSNMVKPLNVAIPKRGGEISA